MESHRVRHDWSDLACMHALEKEMTTHSCILAWRIPGTEEPGGLPSMGLHRAGHDWSDLAAAAATTSNSQKFCFLFQVHWALLVCGSYFSKGDVCMKGYSSSSLKWKMRYPFQNFWPSYATEPTERKGVTPLSRMIDLYYHQDNHLIWSRYHLEPCIRADREDCP